MEKSNDIIDIVNFLSGNRGQDDIRRRIYSIKKQTINKVIKLCFDTYFLSSLRTHNKHILLCILRKFQFSLNDKEISKVKKFGGYFNLTATYIHSLIGNVNLNKSLNHKFITNIILSYTIISYVPFRVVYKNGPPVSKLFYNYNYVLKKLNEIKIKELIRDKCVCNKTPFNAYSDETHKHVVSGDTNIISNNKVRNLLNKGTKYRNPPFITKK